MEHCSGFMVPQKLKFRQMYKRVGRKRLKNIAKIIQTVIWSNEKRSVSAE